MLPHIWVWVGKDPVYCTLGHSAVFLFLHPMLATEIILLIQLLFNFPLTISYISDSGFTHPIYASSYLTLTTLASVGFRA